MSTCSNCLKLQKQLDECKKELEKSKDNFKAHKADLEEYINRMEQGEKVLKSQNKELQGHIEYLTKQLDERDKELQRVKNRYKTNHQASLIKNEPYKRKIVKKVKNNKNLTTFKEGNSLANY